MLRDAATDIFNLQYALLEKCGLALIERVFFVEHSGTILQMNDKSIHWAPGLFLHNT